MPNLKKVLAHIADSKDKNIVITSVGEYLRFAQKYESSVRCIHSIMTYPAHSAKACYADYDGKPVFDSAKFREDCVRMFKDLEKDFSKSSWSLSGRPFKIMVEDAGLDNRGVQDYCVYLLYN